MNDGQNATATEQTAPTSAPAQTMADIASSIQGSPDTSVSQPDSTNDNITDFTEFVAKSNSKIGEIEQKLEKVTGEHNELVNSQHRETVNKEIKSAAERINAESGGDPEMAELYLKTQYEKDPALQKVWDNRYDNPEALDKALALVSNEWKAKNLNTIDPQVAENQRALQESQRSGHTVQSEDINTRLDALSDAEFLHEMKRLRQN